MRPGLRQPPDAPHRRRQRNKSQRQKPRRRQRSSRIFFFQAEDGIRDLTGTGVQTWALPISATQKVRRHIAQQLALRDALVLVGAFVRPNLTYRVLPRHDEWTQVLAVLERHKGEAGIIYCIRRRDVDALAEKLRKKGYDAVAYHAGLTQDERRRAQDRFASE